MSSDPVTFVENVLKQRRRRLLPLTFLLALMGLVAIIAFIAARVIYAALYLANISLWRSIAWTAGYCCVLALFVVSA